MESIFALLDAMAGQGTILALVLLFSSYFGLLWLLGIVEETIERLGAKD